MAEVDSSNQLDNNSSSLNDSPQSSNGIVADNSNGKNGDSNQGKKIIGKSKWKKNRQTIHQIIPDCGFHEMYCVVANCIAKHSGGHKSRKLIGMICFCLTSANFIYYGRFDLNKLLKTIINKNQPLYSSIVYGHNSV